MYRRRLKEGMRVEYHKRELFMEYPYGDIFTEPRKSDHFAGQ